MQLSQLSFISSWVKKSIYTFWTGSILDQSGLENADFVWWQIFNATPLARDALPRLTQALSFASIKIATG